MKIPKLIPMLLMLCILLTGIGCNANPETETPANGGAGGGTDDPHENISPPPPPTAVDGSELAFLRNQDIWLFSDNREQQLTAEGDVTFMQWSSDGNKIMFFRGYGSKGDLWVMDADGKNLEIMADDVFMQQPVSLRSGLFWHPAGDQIAYLRGSDLVIQNLDGGVINEISLDYDYFGGPWWSPDGRTLTVWGAEPDYSASLHFYDPSGGQLEKLQFVSSPFWSDEGVLFVREVPEELSGYLIADGVYIADHRGSNQQSVYDGSLLWSPMLAVDPGGRRMVISDAANIYVLQTDSFKMEFSIQSEVVNTQSEFAHPFWFAFCPQGNRLAVLNYYLQFEGENWDEGYWILKVYDSDDNYRGFDVWPQVYQLFGQHYQVPVPMQGVQPFFWTRDGNSLLVLQDGDNDYDVWLVSDVLARADQGDQPLLKGVMELFVRP